MPVEEMRREHQALVPEKKVEVQAVEYLGIPSLDGKITTTVRCYVPNKKNSRTSDGLVGALVYIHGGGWTVGNLDEFEGAMRIIAEESGHQVYAIEYHLAPEFKYPYQLKEVEAILTWLANNGKARGVDPSRICIGGDSAGGNMSAVTCLRARDREESGYKGPDLAMQLLLYPETALPFTTLAGSENCTGYYLETSGVLLFAWNMLPQGQDHSVQWITPLNAKSHGNLPPAHVVTNGFDPLRDVGHSYAQALQKDGTTVSFVHHEDMTHGFIQFTEKSKRCLQLTKDIGHVLHDAL